jgi:hypothetical protein
VFVACCLSSRPADAASLPSLFRGVVVADSPLGVRVISVEEDSQAFLADLRPEDLIVSINEQELKSIDEFATVSERLRGQAVEVRLVIFRRGEPRRLRVHVFSYPVLQAWGVEFVPAHDVRFAQPSVGLAYWTRLGRGFEEARRPLDALDAYLNGLHNVPEDVPTAVKAAELLSRLSQQRLADKALLDGLASLQQSVVMLERLFNHPLSDEQLLTVKRSLEATMASLQALAI